MQTGSSDKSVPDVVSISGIVEDSPHKFNPDDSLSELELEELLEDIRFGMVRSINVAKKTNVVGTMECNEVSNTSAATDAYGFQFANRSRRDEQPSESTSRLRDSEKSEPLDDAPDELM
ncbi:uncharacterized protein LOC121777183 [Salvia splendens]|nr:uncharacterized protein LOC121777183 [Salvia splendens]XP_042030291.1 uncharacterized protein LOC121777183 [Salvia splendens]